MRIFGIVLVAMLATVTLYGASPDNQGFIRDWLIGGAYPSYLVNGVDQGFKDDPLIKSGGEANLRPYEGMKDEALFKADKSKLIAGIGSTNEWGYTEDKSFPVVWKKFVQTDESPKVMLDGRFEPIDDHMIAYAVCYLMSPEERKIRLRIGSDDDFKVWVNGELAGSANSSQNIIPDSFLHDATLRRGLNVLVLKIVDRTHKCGFVLAISDRKDQPMTDLTVLTDDPARIAMKRDRLTSIPDAFDNGAYANFALNDAVALGGKNTLQVTTGMEENGSVEARLSIGIAGKSPQTFQRKLDFKGKPLQWNESVELPVGKCQAQLTLTRTGESKPFAILGKTFEIYDLAVITSRNRELKTQRGEWQRKLQELEAKKSGLVRTRNELRQRHVKLYSELEKAYAELRQRSRGGIEANSIDVPLEPAPEAIRQSILLNGDRWLMAIGTSADDQNQGYTPPTDDSWKNSILPRVHFDPYFRINFYPLTNVDPKNRYGKVESAKGWEDFTYDGIPNWKKFWARLDIDLGAEATERSWDFSCEAVNGLLKVYMNGEYCGRWEGNIGEARIPLQGVKPGINRLEIYFSDPVTEFKLHKINKFSREFGLLGNILLESSTSDVKVEEVAIKTRIRNNTIETLSEIVNRSSKPVEVRLVQSCVLEGKVRFRLPEAKGKIATGKSLELKSSGVWNDPKLWGIGGKYGDPVLYDLVSDLYIDGKIIDRKVQPFGFREFWIAGSDFFLNGHHIILQGDSGIKNLETTKHCEVRFPLLRNDGINIIRNHDGAHYSRDFFRSCDQSGMLAYANMYPILLEKDHDQPENFIPYEEFLATPRHEFNLRNYRRWFKMLQNHPSVVILSTDNEIFTQAWDTPAKEKINVRSDRLGALYAQYVKSLDPERVMTRDGDVGTWGFADKYHDTPACDTANYHYPDFNVNSFVRNWQTVFGFRPAVYGETLYYSYGAWDKWIGAIPTQVAKKAKRVAEIGQLYRELEVPGQIYMGLVLDGYCWYDETGQGNVWGITSAQHEAKEVPDLPGYPWIKLPWPSLSGQGIKSVYASIDVRLGGQRSFNWFDPDRPSHVRNAVNEAFKATLLPMPELPSASNAECLVELGSVGADGVVLAESVSNPTVQYGVMADSEGTAWLVLPVAGQYRISIGGSSKVVDIPSRGGYAAKPGFDEIMKIDWRDR